MTTVTMGVPEEIQAIRERDSNSGSNPFMQGSRDRRTLLAALDEVTAENAILRTCFCIGADEKVASSEPGSIVIDSNGGQRRRYMTATNADRNLDDENVRLRSVADQLVNDLAITRQLHSEMCRAVKRGLGYENWPTVEGDFHEWLRQHVESELTRLRGVVEPVEKILAECTSTLTITRHGGLYLSGTRDHAATERWSDSLALALAKAVERMKGGEA